MSQTAKLISQPTIMSETLKSRERRHFMMALSRTSREVHTNYDHGITTSNDIPRGHHNPYEINRGVVNFSKEERRSNNDLVSNGNGDAPERGRSNVHELGENHGTNISEYIEDRNFEDDLDLSVIPLTKKVTTDTNSDSF